LKLQRYSSLQPLLKVAEENCNARLCNFVVDASVGAAWSSVVFLGFQFKLGNHKAAAHVAVDFQCWSL